MPVSTTPGLTLCFRSWGSNYMTLNITMFIIAFHKVTTDSTLCYGITYSELSGKNISIDTKALFFVWKPFFLIFLLRFGHFAHSDYNENDRVNPKSQLDKKTGKSLEYIENLKSRQL